MTHVSQIQRVKSEDPCILCRHPSPWDAVGMKHIFSKSSLHTGFELLPGITIFAYRNHQNQVKPSGKRKTISAFSDVFGSAWWSPKR